VYIFASVARIDMCVMLDTLDTTKSTREMSSAYHMGEV